MGSKGNQIKGILKWGKLFQPDPAQRSCTNVNRFVQGLEKQNVQLRHGIMEMYRIMQEGMKLDPVENNDAGQPLIHKLLERLGVLDAEDGSEAMPNDTAWSDSCQPAVNQSFMPLPESPPVTPSFQSVPFGGFNHIPSAGYTTGPPLQNGLATAETPSMGDIVPFGQTAQTTSGLMLSMPSPSSSLAVMSGDDSMTLFNSYGPVQWPGFTPQEELYDFPGCKGIP